jgi:magnesium transporter
MLNFSTAGQILMIRTLLFYPDTLKLKQGGEELINLWIESPNAILWLDIEKELALKEQRILERFQIHPLAIQDHLFILLRGLDADTSGIEFGVIQLAIFTGDRLFITRHARKSTSTNWLFTQVTKDPTLLSKDPAVLAVMLASRLVRRYVEILLAFEPRLDEIEEEIFDRPEDALLYELTRHKAKLREIRRIASYHLQVTLELADDISIIGPEHRHEITDVREQIERTVSLADLYYETAKDLTDGYIALSTHRLNRVMQILTIITVIFVPLTFIAGIYGMNFENMPELKSNTGYFIVLGTMATIGSALLYLFRRKGWV